MESEKKMKEKIEEKIDSIINYIISKPNDKITTDDYMILASEVRDIRFRESESVKQERMERLLANAVPTFTGFNGAG